MTTQVHNIDLVVVGSAILLFMLLFCFSLGVFCSSFGVLSQDDTTDFKGFVRDLNNYFVFYRTMQAHHFSCFTRPLSCRWKRGPLII